MSRSPVSMVRLEGFFAVHGLEIASNGMRFPINPVGTLPYFKALMSLNVSRLSMRQVAAVKGAFSNKPDLNVHTSYTGNCRRGIDEHGKPGTLSGMYNRVDVLLFVPPLELERACRDFMTDQMIYPLGRTRYPAMTIRFSKRSHAMMVPGFNPLQHLFFLNMLEGPASVVPTGFLEVSTESIGEGSLLSCREGIVSTSERTDEGLNYSIFNVRPVDLATASEQELTRIAVHLSLNLVMPPPPLNSEAFVVLAVYLEPGIGVSPWCRRDDSDAEENTGELGIELPTGNSAATSPSVNPESFGRNDRMEPDEHRSSSVVNPFKRPYQVHLQSTSGDARVGQPTSKENHLREGARDVRLLNENGTRNRPLARVTPYPVPPLRHSAMRVNRAHRPGNRFRRKANRDDATSSLPSLFGPWNPSIVSNAGTQPMCPWQQYVWGGTRPNLPVARINPYRYVAPTMAMTRPSLERSGGVVSQRARHPNSVRGTQRGPQSQSERRWQEAIHLRAGARFFLRGGRPAHAV